MGDNLGFQERWEFRRKEFNEDSSSDGDSKSNSEQVFKSRRLIVDDDYHSDNPTQMEPEEGNPRTKSESKCRKPRKKQQSRVTTRNKLINDKAAQRPRRKKNSGIAYNPRLMEDLKSFSESLLKDMKASGEKMFIKMKEEMFELQSSGISIANNRISKMGYAQVLKNQRNVRYIHNQMPPGLEDAKNQGLFELNRNRFIMDNMTMNQLPIRENTNAVCDFPLVQHLPGLLLGRGLPNMTLHWPFVMSGGYEVTRIPNIQHHLNSEPSVYRSRNIVNLQPSSRGDSSTHDMLRRNSLSNLELGLLLRNEARDQSCTPTELCEREIMKVERMRNIIAGVPFMNNGTRQLQATVDERAAFHVNFSGPIMLRQRDNEQTVGLLNDPNFNANSSLAASSMYLTFPDGSPMPYVKSQIIRPSSIQHITSGNQVVINGGFSRMRAEGRIRNGYLEMEQNNNRGLPQEQSYAPNCSIQNR